MIQAKSKAARDSAGIAADFQKAVQSGDRHLIRAYAELLPSILPAASKDRQDVMTRADALNMAKTELARVMAVPGADKLQEEAAELLRDAREFQAAAADAAQFFEHNDQVTRGFFTSTGPLAQLVNSIEITEAYDRDSGGFNVNLTIAEPGAENPNVRVKDAANVAG